MGLCGGGRTYHAAEGATRESEHVWGEWRRRNDQQPHVAAHARLYLAEDQLVPDAVFTDYTPAKKRNMSWMVPPVDGTFKSDGTNLRISSDLALMAIFSRYFFTTLLFASL